MSKSKFPEHLTLDKRATNEMDANGNEHVWIPSPNEQAQWLRMSIQSQAEITRQNDGASSLAVRIQEYREFKRTLMQRLLRATPDNVVDAPIGKEGTKVPLSVLGKSRKALLVWAEQNGLQLDPAAVSNLFPNITAQQELFDAWLLELNTEVSLQEHNLPGQMHQSKEMRELAAERQRLQSALDEAISLNLITLEQFGDPSDKECLILPSYHWTEDDIFGRFQNAEIEKATALSQYQMFAFSYLLQKNNLSSPLFIEGLEVGSKPNRLPYTVLADAPVSIYSRDGQAVLFEDPNYFMKVANPQRRGCVLNFSDFTCYEYIQGSHDPAVVAEVQQFLENEMQLLRASAIAYYPSGKFEGPPQAVKVDGKIKILFNGVLRDPKMVVSECDAGNEAYRRYQEGIRKIAELREQEIVKRFTEVPPVVIPMAWMGLAHAEPVRKLCLKQDIRVCMVIPNAVLNRVREIRSSPKRTPTRTQTEMLRDFAAKYIQQGSP
ncbi:MAG: hypothetical protein WC840_05615 [Candidatus Peribacteraceae bacterium]